MAPAVVYLHIGSPKTGTTYLQDSLWLNRETLASAGVLLPGRTRTIAGKWISELIQWDGEGEQPPGWRRLCHEVNGADAQSVIISHEHLNKTTPAQWNLVLDTIEASRFEIVLTARDLARSVPAQWQSSVRQRYTWTLGEYADAVAATPPGKQVDGPARHFWRRQDSPTILDRFVGRVGVDRVRLVTVPPSGGDPDELWWRFCRASGIDASITQPAAVAHESLGAASAELMRRLNASGPVEELSVADYKKAVNHGLSRHTLAQRRGEEPGLTLPDRHRDWAERQAERLIRGIEATGVEVVGDLDDLRPRPAAREFVSPEDLPAGDLLDAALAGLAGMAVQQVELRALLDEATRAAAEARADVAGSRSGAGRGGAAPRGALDVVRRRLRRDA
jgi:hypothetical protein